MMALKMYRGQDRGRRRMKMHDVHRLEPWKSAGEQCGNNCEILGYVVGDGKRGQRTPGHKELLSNLDDFNKFRRIGVQVHHVPGFLRRLGPGIHRQPYIRLGEGRRVVGAVAHHRDQLAVGLLFADISEFRFRSRLRDKVIDARLLCNRRGGERIVAGDHDGAQTHVAQPIETLAHPRLEDVLQRDHAGDFGTSRAGRRRGHPPDSSSNSSTTRSSTRPNTDRCGSLRIRDGEFVTAEVVDTGIGIPRNDQSRIFERFYRVDKARSRQLGGTGLGLSIVKHLIQSIGGQIEVTSRVGSGSRFTIFCPGAGLPRRRPSSWKASGEREADCLVRPHRTCTLRTCASPSWLP